MVRMENEQTNEQIKEAPISVVAAPKRDYFLPASILIAGVLVAGSVVYLVWSGQQARVAPSVPTTGASAANPADIMKLQPRDVILGKENAPVTLIEYGDYQCPFCAKFFTESEQRLRDEYIATGKVRMVFRNFQFLGAESNAAAEAAACAEDQGQFWAYHDALYRFKLADSAKGGGENDGSFNATLFGKLAADIKLNASKFASCIGSHTYEKQVTAENTAAKGIGVGATPTFYVNGTQIVGAVPYGELAQAIDAALKSN